MQNKLKKVVISITMLLLMSGVAFATSYTVAPTATQLAEAGSSANPAEWSLAADFVTSTTDFTIGGGGIHYNYLTIDSTYSFSTTNDMKNGPVHSSHNQLNVIGGGQVTVGGNLYNGWGSISYYSNYNLINVSGANSHLSVLENLDISSGYNATNNYLRLTNNGLATVGGDFSLYYHWAYGNNWLELGGGALLLKGDKVGDFSSGHGILSSIKVWDDSTNAFQRVAYYDHTTLVENPEYFNMLSVEYLNDATEAAALGFSGYEGYTVIRNVNPVPLPTTLLLFGSGLFGLVGLRRRKQS